MERLKQLMCEEQERLNRMRTEVEELRRSAEEEKHRRLESDARRHRAEFPQKNFMHTSEKRLVKYKEMTDQVESLREQRDELLQSIVETLSSQVCRS